MFLRVAIPSLALTAALSILACQSSGPYGTRGTVAAQTGLAVGAAVISRAAGGCYAQCLPGTACNTKTGLCERIDKGKGTASVGAKPMRKQAPVASASYPEGHESEIPPLSDPNCDPASLDAGSLSCEMDAATSH